MTHYTIIKSDQAIYIDGEAIKDCDMSGSLEFHALQYNTETGGQVEYSDNSGNIQIADENEIQTLTGLSLTEWINRRNLAIEAQTLPPLEDV